MVDGYRLRIMSWHCLGQRLGPGYDQSLILTHHLWDLDELSNIDRDFETFPAGKVQEKWDIHHDKSKNLDMDSSDERHTKT